MIFVSSITILSWMKIVKDMHLFAFHFQIKHRIVPINTKYYMKANWITLLKRKIFVSNNQHFLTPSQIGDGNLCMPPNASI